MQPSCQVKGPWRQNRRALREKQNVKLCTPMAANIKLGTRKLVICCMAVIAKGAGTPASECVCNGSTWNLLHSKTVSDEHNFNTTTALEAAGQLVIGKYLMRRTRADPFGAYAVHIIHLQRQNWTGYLRHYLFLASSVLCCENAGMLQGLKSPNLYCTGSAPPPIVSADRRATRTVR